MGFFDMIFGGSKKASKRASSSKSSGGAKRSASKATSKKKAPSKKSTRKNTKRQTEPKTTSQKKKNVQKMILIPVVIKDHRDRNGGHHHVIVDDIEDKHISVGLTQDAKKGKNATNYSCKVSPLGDGKHSYMRRQAQVAPKSEYYNPQQGRMEKSDYERAQIYGERAKQKYLVKKEQEKSNEVPNT